jgi:hypothetical protein
MMAVASFFVFNIDHSELFVETVLIVEQSAVFAVHCDLLFE